MSSEDRILTILEQMQADMKDLKQGQAKIEYDVAELKQGQAKIEASITKIEARITKIEARITKLEERITKLEERITKLERDVAVLKHDVAVIKQDIIGIRRQLVEHNDIIRALTHNIEVTNARQNYEGYNAAKLEALEHDVAKHEGYFAGMAKAIS